MVIDLTTLQLGVTAWREIINANMAKIIQAFAGAASKNGTAGENFAAKDIQIAGNVDLSGIDTTTETELPANPVGFIKVKIKGTVYKMPYYAL